MRELTNRGHDVWAPAPRLAPGHRYFSAAAIVAVEKIVEPGNADDGVVERRRTFALQRGGPRFQSTGRETTKPPGGGLSLNLHFATSRKFWSGRRDSNPRPRPWQGRALPLSYTRIREFGGDRSPATGRAMPNAARECNSRPRPSNRADRLISAKMHANQPKTAREPPLNLLNVFRRHRYSGFQALNRSIAPRFE